MTVSDDNRAIEFLRGVARRGYDWGDGYPLRCKDATEILQAVRADKNEERFKTGHLPDNVECPGCGEHQKVTPYLEDDDITVCQKCGTRIIVEIVCYAVGYKAEER